MKPMLFPLLALTTSFVITNSTPVRAGQLSLHSSSFTDRSTIPTIYTCEGKNVSPELAWHGAPAGTESYALICEDPDAPAGIWYHWVIFNIPRVVTEIPEGSGLPGGATPGANSWGRTQYSGPCPPSSIHRYNFTLYALDSHLQLPNGADAKQVMNAMQGHVLQKTTIMGVFGH